MVENGRQQEKTSNARLEEVANLELLRAHGRTAARRGRRGPGR